MPLPDLARRELSDAGLGAAAYSREGPIEYHAGEELPDATGRLAMKLLLRLPELRRSGKPVKESRRSQKSKSLKVSGKRQSLHMTNLRNSR